MISKRIICKDYRVTFKPKPNALRLAVSPYPSQIHSLMSLRPHQSLPRHP